jgi:hypothetical protein
MIRGSIAAGNKGSPPNLVGDVWFEELRTHLPFKYRDAHVVICDDETITNLSQEIGRIEQRWIDEAHG